MNYRKGSAKKIHMSPCSFWHTEQFCHIFTPVDQLLCSILHKSGPTTHNEPFTAYNIMALCVCWLIARGAVSTLYSFLKHGHDLLCMLVCLRLCDVTIVPSHLKVSCEMQSSDEQKSLFIWWLHLAWNFKLRATKKTCVSFCYLTSSSLAVEHFQWKDYPILSNQNFNVDVARAYTS